MYEIVNDKGKCTTTVVFGKVSNTPDASSRELS